MRAAGMTFAEIAEATGYHRTTIAKWIANGGPPAKRAPVAERVVVTDRWQTEHPHDPFRATRAGAYDPRRPGGSILSTGPAAGDVRPRPTGSNTTEATGYHGRVVHRDNDL